MAIATDTVRHSYEALGHGNAPAVISILDEHVEWMEAERFPVHVAASEKIWQSAHS
jgi:hypothetical protein